MVETTEFPDPEYLLKHLVWFNQKGFPEGSLGMMLKSVYEIKLNGLESLFEPLRNSQV
jgi:uncharacterized protein (DUF3820 family)